MHTVSCVFLFLFSVIFFAAALLLSVLWYQRTAVSCLLISCVEVNRVGSSRFALHSGILKPSAGVALNSLPHEISAKGRHNHGVKFSPPY